MADPAAGMNLGHAVVLLSAAVVAVPLFRKLGMGSVLGYLTAGVIIGPFALGMIGDAEAILHVAELGVVMFLFIIGLEMRPAKLWKLRKEIFGLGAAQVVTASVLLTLTAIAFGIAPAVAFVGASGFVLSSTAVIMQTLDERNEINTPHGQRAVSILLLEDLAIVPLLAIVAVLGTALGTAQDGPPLWQTIGFAVAAVVGVILAGKYAINPIFRQLAKYGGREVMLAAALLVVCGAAWALSLGGLSMAMGAFLAGVLLSDSTFRHQLEADVDPFRSILLGLFFLSVGMSLNLGVVVTDWRWVVGGVVVFMLVKAIGIYTIARLFKAKHPEALERSALFAQGGEFAFVLFGAAMMAGLFDARTAAIFTAIVILSMVATPLVTAVVSRFFLKEAEIDVDEVDGVDRAQNLRERVLVIGFGRFAQVVCQPLLARDVDVSIIDMDVEMIQAAGNFGFKVYYGDGSRLDVLRASGAETAETILVCVDKPEAADRIVELVKAEFPLTKLFVRAYDRGHSIRLINAGVEFHIRETFESALAFGEHVLKDLGFSEDEARETIEDVRRRDEERLTLQVTGGLQAGRSLWRNNTSTPQPEPYVKPRREARALNEDTAEVMVAEDEERRQEQA
ncbi:monovalent cation:proton antiporter-2 (CPA2) family protein [Brevundimonas sp. NIBR11]|uniref:monovalent cation:proton antiporter-2 (CPA2) family protein n=1 Tax=Brevundimonas sp. NIBR11 TaxID=3015999 RepID=UPI0022F02049|nr:monovalent cation:proton antiporter-2 (CPA2) family protein [Brevundimonas sp. NIBR11]WGM32088.1 Glutathione-regulated potassium-efflux system protein KefC [Brevundimonas sp. NIBR11]